MSEKASQSVQALERECDKLREERDEWFHRYEKVVDILDRMKATDAQRSGDASRPTPAPADGER